MSVKSSVYSKLLLFKYFILPKKYYHFPNCIVILGMLSNFVSYLGYLVILGHNMLCTIKNMFFCFHFKTSFDAQKLRFQFFAVQHCKKFHVTVDIFLGVYCIFCNTYITSSTVEQLKLVKYQRWNRSSHRLHNLKNSNTLIGKRNCTKLVTSS